MCLISLKRERKSNFGSKYLTFSMKQAAIHGQITIDRDCDFPHKSKQITAQFSCHSHGTTPKKKGKLNK